MPVSRGVLLFVLGVAGCESAANLDVTYQSDAGAARDGGAIDAGGADADAHADADAGAPVVLEACPCDRAAGQGCCVTAKDAFCTDSATICATEKGTFLACARRDTTTESECCWHGSGAGALTAFAATCSGAEACLADADCAQGVACETSTCAGFTFGACGQKPVCP